MIMKLDVKPDNCRDSILAMTKKENVSAKENKAVLNITTSNYDDWEESNWCWLITERWQQLLNCLKTQVILEMNVA